MERHHVGARLGEARHVTFRLDDHQMHVETLRRRLANSFQHGKSERDIRHENAVHHVYMDPFGRAAVDHLRIALQVAEIGRQHRRCYYSVHCSVNIVFYRQR